MLGTTGIAATATKSAATTVPELHVADVTTAEGDAGYMTLKVPVTLSAPTSAKIKVPYTVSAAADGVTDGHDFVARKGQLTIAAGKTSGSVNVTWVGDTIVEPDQHVSVTLGTPVGGTATLADGGVGTVTILDDDATPKPSAIVASIGDVTMDPPDATSTWVTGTIPVTLSKPATVQTKVVFALDCNALSSIQNVQMRSKGALTFGIGQQVKLITFEISADDYSPQQIQDIAVNIQSELNAVKVVDTRGDVTVNGGGGQLSHNQGYPVPNFVPSAIPGPSSFNAQSVGDVEQVTLTPSGGQPYDYPTPEMPTWGPGSPSLSYDGRYDLFESPQTDLVPGDTNGLADLFVRDRQTNTTTRVDLHQDGSQVMPADGPLGASLLLGYEISANGRYVVYSTDAQIDPRDTGPYPSWLYAPDVYLYDRVTHTTELESVDSAGNIIHGAYPVVSADGRYIAFEDLIDRDPVTDALKVYVHDRLTGATTVVFKNALGQLHMSRNGQFLLVGATGLTCMDGELDVVDLSNGTTERVDVTDDGEAADNPQVGGPASLYTPAISDDGRYVAFESAAPNLLPDGVSYPPGALYVYLRDRQDLSTTLVGYQPGGAPPRPVIGDNYLSMSGDGARLAVSASAGAGALVYNLTDGTSTTVGPGLGPNNVDTMWWDDSALSGDGRYLSWVSERYDVYDTVVRREVFATRVS